MVVGALVVCGGAQVGYSQHKPLPESWFYPDRPATLKSIEGKPVPELRTKTWIGDKVDVGASKGKVIVIDFWATWCPPCVASIPKNIELVKKHKDDGLVFIGVHDASSGWDKTQGMVNDKKINYPVALDADGGVSAKAFNVAFWPTYVVVDRAGVVRGAGLRPDQVGEAVKMLLAEPAPNMPAAGAKSEFPDEWFYGGASRAASMRAIEGKTMPALKSEQWSKEPLEAAAMKDQVVIVHFLSAGNPAAMRQAETLAAFEKEMGPQGVVVVGVAAADDAWEPLTKLVEAGKLPSRLCQDAAVESKDDKKGTPPGAIAGAYGVRYFPAIVVIDRAGKVRATSVKTDKLKELATKLLAENPAKAAETKAPSAGE